MIKLVLGAVLTAGAAAGGLAAAAASTATPTAALTQACVPGHLKPAFGGRQGAAGTLQDTWRLTNVGTAACQFGGYATVHNYRSDGRPLPTSVTHLGTPHAVLLAPGQHASFALRFTDPGVLGCVPSPAAMLTIQAPGTTLPLITQRGERSCHGVLKETPVVHGG
jgi:hypothetical protein